MVNYLLKFIHDMLFQHYKMTIWGIGDNKFLIDTSLGEKFCNKVDFKIEDVFNRKTLPLINSKSDNEIAMTLEKLLDFIEYCCDHSDMTNIYSNFENFLDNSDIKDKVLNEWEKNFVTSLDKAIAFNLMTISTHFGLGLLTELCTRSLLRMYLGQRFNWRK